MFCYRFFNNHIVVLLFLIFFLIVCLLWFKLFYHLFLLKLCVINVGLSRLLFCCNDLILIKEFIQLARFLFFVTFLMSFFNLILNNLKLKKGNFNYLGY